MPLRILFLATPLALIAITYFLFHSTQNEDLEALLSYGDTVSWEPQSAESDVQWKVTDDGYYWLRTVDADAGHIVIAGVIEGSFIAQSAWFVDCTPGTVITTTQLDESGQNFLLVCDAVGEQTYLRATSFWQEYSLNAPPVWQADYDGFVVNQDFSEWDWEGAKRFITLSRAEVPPE